MPSIPLQTIKLAGLFFITIFVIFNFVDRNISNISLICLLLISIYTISVRKISLTLNYDEKLLIYSFISFSLIIFIMAAYHSSSLDEIDNYSRFLLLIPIYFFLKTIVVNPKFLIYIVIASSLLSITSVLIIYDESPGNMIIPGRINPVSSTALTYGNLNMTLFIVLIGCWLFKDKFKISSLLLMLALISSFMAWGFTHTKGSIIGLIFVLIYLNFINKFIRVFTLTIVLLGAFIISSTDLNKRFKIFINDTVLLINGENIMSDNIDLSTRERFFYYKNAIEIINNNPFKGIGFNDFENYLIEKKDRKV